jgi:SAM-dependent methyltransferase
MTEIAVKLHRLLEEFADAIACAVCGERLVLARSQDAVCGQCNESYRWLGHTWNLMPLQCRESSELWAVWDQLQINGLVSYRADPEHNLAVGERPDCRDFSDFCGFDGRVLDVGCGPQLWPAYFRGQTARTRFVGVDPLIEGPSAQYLQLRAVAEYLPLRSSVFDHVVFATSLDHFVDPVRALGEARRACRADGQIDVWVGEKRAGAPPRAESPGWYRRLERPSGSDDLFHIKRLDVNDVERLVQEAGLHTRDHEVRRVDEFRMNHFFRLAPSE